MPTPLFRTDFHFPGQQGKHVGKVRDNYLFDDTLLMVCTDRISAFDTVFQQAVPYKGFVVNQLAVMNLNRTSHIIPNWMTSSPHPNVTVGRRCDPYPVEVIVRGYLSGHAWRIYRDGGRALCGVNLPEGLTENERLPHPIVTPTSKSQGGKRRGYFAF